MGEIEKGVDLKINLDRDENFNVSSIMIIRNLNLIAMEIFFVFL